MSKKQKQKQKKWVCLMDADVDPFFIVISVSHFSIGTQIFCLSK